ncbi:NUDIX domain-containing protein, partial [Streptomyces sp. NPDC088178]|uniref:NUDIX domain-containing protein n=1 Tax=Streptomyces sp. NPDC088178 TaxID=3365836 RepID=UPI0038298858
MATVDHISSPASGPEPAILKAVDEPLTRGFLRLPSRKSANPPASPGGAVDKGESPAQGAARELEEELGVTANVTRGLAVDWVSPAGPAAAPALRFPGEILHVFDGGVWDEDQIAAIRPAPGEIEAVEFVEPADLPALMSPGDARRALSALRARIAGTGPALLEDGLPIAPTVLDRVGVLRTARGCRHPPFHPRPVPDGLTVRQSWVWAFAPDGRGLVLLEPDTGAACLPGGTPDLADHADPEATLIRKPARRPPPSSPALCSANCWRTRPARRTSTATAGSRATWSCG